MFLSVVLVVFLFIYATSTQLNFKMWQLNIYRYIYSMSSSLSTLSRWRP